MRVSVLILAALFAASPLRLDAATPALLQATVDGKTFRGKLVGKDASICWLMDRDGRLVRLEIDKIDKIESIAPKFRPHTAAELRDLVRRDYAKDFDVIGTGKYVICAQPRQAVRYAALFDGMYRSVHLYFSRRGFKLDEPEFPMIAIVLPNRAAFAQQCERDGIRGGGGLLGYYHPDTNRVALFDPGDEPAQASAAYDFFGQSLVATLNRLLGEDSMRGAMSVLSAPWENRAFGRPPAGEIAADLQATIVHEATHQVAFNIGLHSRVGKNPKWVVEGLASAFENASMYDGSAAGSQRERMNRDRFIWFMNYSATRRKPGALQEFIVSDRLFMAAGQDAYAQSWALTFFLLETRPGKYAAYLKSIAERDPMNEYPPEDRLGDFCAAFGKNLDQFDAEFLRFFDRLK